MDHCMDHVALSNQAKCVSNLLPNFELSIFPVPTCTPIRFYVCTTSEINGTSNDFVLFFIKLVPLLHQNLPHTLTLELSDPSTHIPGSAHTSNVS